MKTSRRGNTISAYARYYNALILTLHTSYVLDINHVQSPPLRVRPQRRSRPTAQSSPHRKVHRGYLAHFRRRLREGSILWSRYSRVKAWHDACTSSASCSFSCGLNESLLQHGKPVRTIECGTTEIPEETFDEYLDDLRSSYTAAKYHLLDFNCNSFTADVVGFLTGQEIPEWITSKSQSDLFLKPPC